MKTLRKNVACFLVVTMFFIGLGIQTQKKVSAAGDLTGKYENQGNTVEDIVAKWHDLNMADAGNSPPYTVAPNWTEPYNSPGSLTQNALNNALGTTNFIRFLTDLPSVSLNTQYTAQAQAGAYVMAANNSFSHSPENDVNMDADTFGQGYQACATSNIAFSSGYPFNEQYLSGAVFSFMADESSSNIVSVGHRRWIIDPSMTETGFGAVINENNTNVYSAMKAFSTNNDEDTNNYSEQRNYVAWPNAGYMPIEAFSGREAGNNTPYPWSISLDPSIYGSNYSDSVEVSMTNKKTGETTVFQNGMDVTPNGEYFGINTENYGNMAYCVIFRPADSVLSAGDEFKIVISGLKDTSGTDLPDIAYDTAFFSANDENGAAPLPTTPSTPVAPAVTSTTTPTSAVTSTATSVSAATSAPTSPATSTAMPTQPVTSTQGLATQTSTTTPTSAPTSPATSTAMPTQPVTSIATSTPAPSSTQRPVATSTPTLPSMSTPTEPTTESTTTPDGPTSPPSPTPPRLIASGHVQGTGWDNIPAGENRIGTTGQGRRLEAISLDLGINPSEGGIRYNTHIQGSGWQTSVENGVVSGSEGQSKRLEAVTIELTGKIAEEYDIYYRTHIQGFGWLDWAKNGEQSGTVGYALRMEALEIVLMKKGDSAPGEMINSFWDKAIKPSIVYQAHVESLGWQQQVEDGAQCGTSGEGKRLEALCIRLMGMGDLAGGVEYQSHVQGIGWQSPVFNGAKSGTEGQRKRLEAIRIRLTGEVSQKYDIYYRVHTQSLGWMGWAKNGQEAGTAGYAYRLEGIEISLVPKGGAAPGSTVNAFRW